MIIEDSSLLAITRFTAQGTAFLSGRQLPRHQGGLQEWAQRGTVNGKPAVAYYLMDEEDVAEHTDLPFDFSHLDRIEVAEVDGVILITETHSGSVDGYWFASINEYNQFCIDAAENRDVFTDDPEIAEEAALHDYTASCVLNREQAIARITSSAAPQGRRGAAVVEKIRECAKQLGWITTLDELYEKRIHEARERIDDSMSRRPKKPLQLD